MPAVNFISAVTSRPKADLAAGRRNLATAARSGREPTISSIRRNIASSATWGAFDLRRPTSASRVNCAKPPTRTDGSASEASTALSGWDSTDQLDLSAACSTSRAFMRTNHVFAVTSQHVASRSAASSIIPRAFHLNSTAWVQTRDAPEPPTKPARAPSSVHKTHLRARATSAVPTICASPPSPGTETARG